MHWRSSLSHKFNFFKLFLKYSGQLFKLTWVVCILAHRKQNFLPSSDWPYKLQLQQRPSRQQGKVGVDDVVHSCRTTEWNGSFYYVSFSALTFLWPLLPHFYKLGHYCPKPLKWPFNQNCFTIQPAQQFVSILGALRGQMTVCSEIYYKNFIS